MLSLAWSPWRPICFSIVKKLKFIRSTNTEHLLHALLFSGIRDAAMKRVESGPHVGGVMCPGQMGHQPNKMPDREQCCDLLPRALPLFVPNLPTFVEYLLCAGC